MPGVRNYGISAVDLRCKKALTEPYNLWIFPMLQRFFPKQELGIVYIID
jgi:hypothetical protein